MIILQCFEQVHYVLTGFVPVRTKDGMYVVSNTDCKELIDNTKSSSSRVTIPAKYPSKAGFNNDDKSDTQFFRKLHLASEAVISLTKGSISIS